MRCLTIDEPYATLIILGHKQIYTGPFFTCYHRPVLIRAGTHKNQEMHDLAIYLGKKYQIHELLQYDNLPFGKIIGQVNLVEITSTSLAKCIYLTSAKERDMNNFKDWEYSFVFDNPIVFDQPIPVETDLEVFEYGYP